MQNPRQCHLGEGFSSFAGFCIPLLQLLQEFWSQGAVLQEVLLCHAAIGWDAVEIAVGEETLCQRREGDESDAVFVAVVEGSVFLWRTVEHVESVLEDEQRTVALLQILIGELQCLQWPSADAEIECLALLHDVYHCLEGFLEWGIRVVAMAVEEVHIVQIHALEALVEARHQILARAPVAVRTFPHIISRLGRDEEFVTIRQEIILHQSAHGFLSASVRRAIVVGKVEVSDSVVEGIVGDGTASLVRIHSSEVVPESQTNLRQQDSALAASLVKRLCIAIAIGIGSVDSF